MSGRYYTAAQRQALNQIWTAAGSYGFAPRFLAFRQDGKPDLYMNGIVGCAWKWYGEEYLSQLFAAWAGDRRQALLDDLAWLALESAAFSRELSERPVLEALRKAHGEDFFDQEHLLSRQEWMAKNQLSYTMQSARWRAVLGRRPPVMTPRERRLAQALDCGALEGGALRERMLEAFRQAGIFDGRRRTASPFHLHFTGRWRGVMTRLLPTEIVHTDVAVAGAGGLGAGSGPRLDARRAAVRLNENDGGDRAYIESCFGPPMLSPRELSMAEQALCTGDHLGCRLWVTAGVPSPKQAKSGEARQLAEQAQRQYQRNRESFAASSGLYQNALLRLTEQIQNCLQVHSQSEPETARSGRLDSPKVWRAAVLSDGRVFLRDVPAAWPGFSVDLLLDASSSRLHCQEIVAAQGYILAESLQRCGVPVRVSAFCSLRGYTILRVLKEYGDRQGCRKIFRYFASGWNRDGLALRTAGWLLERAPEPRRLLLVLTDASPNDIHRVPPSQRHPLGCDYGGMAGVEDAARTVRALERQNIQTAAIFMGEEMNAPLAEKIYGRNFVRIRSMDQLAAAAGTLIQEKIREAHG